MIFKLKTHKEFSALEAEKNDLLVKLQEAENAFKNLQDMSKDMVEAKASETNVISDLKATYEADIAKLNTEHSAAISQLTEANTAELAKVKADYDKQISELKSEVKKEAVSAEEKVISTLAQIGVPQEEIPSATETVVTPEGCYNKWQSLLATNSKEANQFYNSNRELIKQFVGFRG